MSLANVFGDAKLVVWDLDDTLWHGTLSEGAVSIFRQRAQLIQRLAEAGLVNSICSNNDFAPARRQLVVDGLWASLVFPQIGWGSKVPMIERIVELAQLRPQQVAFVDDNERVRSEVAEACRVMTVAPSTVDAIELASIPRTDVKRRRLADYRVLEARSAARAGATAKTSEEFLRGCEIELRLHRPNGLERRILELAQRTNQLNFTSTERLQEAEFAELLRDPHTEIRAISVRDRFGDYGVVGAVVVDRVATEVLHLFFSCRVLNMGVAEYVYQRLGAPRFRHPTERTAALAAAPAVDWIAVVSADTPSQTGQDRSRVSVLFIGGCDLETMATYISARRPLAPAWHVGDVERGANRLGHSSLLVLTAASNGHGSELDKVPWVSNWNHGVEYDRYDAIVLSLWVDYVTATSRHRETGLRIPRFGAQSDGEQSVWWGEWPGQSEFRAAYEEAPELTPDEIVAMLADFRRSLPGTSLIVINAPQIELPEQLVQRPDQHLRNQAVNARLDEFVAASDVRLVDVRTHVQSHADLAGDGLLTHYARHIYAKLADDIAAAL